MPIPRTPGVSHFVLSPPPSTAGWSGSVTAASFGELAYPSLAREGRAKCARRAYVALVTVVESPDTAHVTRAFGPDRTAQDPNISIIVMILI
jgi:hypothetical protein